LRAPKARELLDAYWPVGEAIGEGSIVLLREQRGRHEHGDLVAALDGRESRAQRDLRLAEANVAADDAVHGLRAREVLEYVEDRAGLIVRLLERELHREALIGAVVELVVEAFARGALRVEIQQLGGDVPRLLRRFTLRLRPL